MAREGTLFITFDTDNDRLQHASFTTMDRHDFAAGWCGKQHAWRLFIFEQRLPFYDPIAFFDQHRGAHAYVLLAMQGDVLNHGAIRYLLLRQARDGKIQPFFNFNHIVSTE